MNKDDLAARLAEHQDLRRGPDYWYCGTPECDASIAEGDEGPDVARMAFLAHQADAALAWFQEHTSEEWGIRFLHNGNFHEVTPKQDEVWARRNAKEIRDADPANRELFHRRVTAWEEAE